jgi:hypothetical protein
MTQFTEAYDFRGRALVDRAGEKIGTVDEVYSNSGGGQPEWALIHTSRPCSRRLPASTPVSSGASRSR